MHVCTNVFKRAKSVAPSLDSRVFKILIILRYYDIVEIIVHLKILRSNDKRERMFKAFDQDDRWCIEACNIHTKNKC